MEKVLVSGASGFIGSHLIERLKQEGYDVSIVVRPTTDISVVKESVPLQNIVVLDDREELYRKIKVIEPFIYINLMGMFCTRHNCENITQLVDANIKDSLLVLDAVNEAGCKRVINTASYWQNRQNKDYSPINLYAAMKQAFETLLAHYIENENMSVITLTIFDTYGAGDRRKKILNIVYQIQDGETLDLTNGEQKMYLCHIEDIVSGYLTALEKVKALEGGKALKYALRGNGEPIALKEFLMTAVHVWRKDVRLNFGAIKRNKAEIDDPNGYGVVLPGWEAKVGLEDGLKKYEKEMQINGGR